VNDFTYVLMGGRHLLRGSLHGPVPSLMWRGGEDWQEVRIPLCELTRMTHLRVLCDEEAERFLDIRPSAA
jgi:hypothetical protein